MGNQYKYNGQVLELNSDAIIINGAVAGTRTQGPDYRCHEIGNDLLGAVSQLSEETLSLVQQSDNTSWTSPDSINQQYQQAFLSATRATFLLTQWKASYDAQQQQSDYATNDDGAVDSEILDEAVDSAESALGMDQLDSADQALHQLYHFEQGTMAEL